jgi:hypothetical protein
MIDLSITTDIPQKVGKLALLTDLQFRYAVAQAMTDAAKAADAKIRNDMSRYIDRPTPFTAKSTYVTFANPNRLRAEVGFKQFAAKGTPAGKYLSAMARGGDRSHKRSETILRLAGAIGSDQYITPSKENGWAGDPYGNVPRGTYTMMLSQLKAFGGDRSYLNASNSKRSQRKRARAGQFFMSRSGRAILYRPPGGGRDSTEVAFMVLDDAPNHERRFPIVALLNAEVSREYPRLIESSLRRELARAGFG